MTDHMVNFINVVAMGHLQSRFKLVSHLDLFQQ